MTTQTPPTAPHMVQVQNRSGSYVPAIPEPLLSMGHCCPEPGCGERFFTRRGYRGHYALEHVLELG